MWILFRKFLIAMYVKEKYEQSPLKKKNGNAGRNYRLSVSNFLMLRKFNSRSFLLKKL